MEIKKDDKLIKKIPEKFLKSHQGLSLVEVIIVISITAILGASTISLSINFLTSNNFKNKTNEIIASLRTAQINSISGKEDSKWGINISSNKITLYKGDSFQTRDQAFDDSFNIPNNIVIDQTDIVFDKHTGNPATTATIGIRSNTGDTNTIIVNELGIVNLN